MEVNNVRDKETFRGAKKNSSKVFSQLACLRRFLPPVEAHQKRVGVGFLVLLPCTRPTTHIIMKELY